MIAIFRRQLARTEHFDKIWKRALVRLVGSFRKHGLFITLVKCVRYPVYLIRSARYQSVFASSDPVEVFNRIYGLRIWGRGETICGPGSTLAYTAQLREKLPELFRLYDIKTIFDAPCGDFNWMRQVLEEARLDYIGGDIVSALIVRNRNSFKGESTHFVTFNIISDQFPEADIWICRDCLFHFSFQDIYRTLENYCRSNVPFVLTTTHLNTSGFENLDIRTGEFRRIDLFSSPFCLPREVKFRIDDTCEPWPSRELCLWERSQVAQALAGFGSALSS